MFDITTKPEDWRLEQPQNDEKYYRFILIMGLKTDIDYRLLDQNSKLIFKKRGGERTLELPCSPLRKYFGRTDKNIGFFIELSLKNYLDLESLRMGGHLMVKLSVNEMFLVPFTKPEKGRRESPQSATEIFTNPYIHQYFDSIMIKYDTTKFVDAELLILQDDWVEKVIKPLGLGERFIVEIPCKLPTISEGTLSPDLNDLKDKLEKGILKLKDAIEEYNKGRDAEKCIAKVREASDNLHGIKTFEIKYEIGKAKDLESIRLYSEFLIENTGTGSKEISIEIMQSVQIIIDQIFNMASKVPHGLTRKKETFDYDPCFEDAEMILGIMSLIYYWMSTKFNTSITGK
jgi:hypothetical protein